MPKRYPVMKFIIVAAYEWRPGDCYRCGAKGVPTAIVGEVAPQDSPPVKLRACKDCTIALERERDAAAARYGWPYQAGTPVEGSAPPPIEPKSIDPEEGS